MSLQTGCPVSEWHEHIVPLDPAWGEIRVAFRFDVHDDLLNYVGGWMVDDLVVLGNCLGSTPYCTAKLNSQGCTPSIFTTGAPSYFGSSTPFLVHAQQVLNQHPGMAIWSLTQASNPLAGGTLCVGGPLVRTPGQGSGGNAGPPDCSGTYVYQFTKPYMQAQSLVPGKTVHVQFWSRDTGFAEPDNVGLTAGVSFTICN
jgi:hypothetical protein